MDLSLKETRYLQQLVHKNVNSTKLTHTDYEFRKNLLYKLQDEAIQIDSDFKVFSFVKNLAIVFECSEVDTASQLKNMVSSSANTIISFSESIREMVEMDIEMPYLTTVINDLSKLANTGIKSSEAGKLYGKYLICKRSGNYSIETMPIKRILENVN